MLRHRKPFAKTHRIAITGIGRAGKTALLTSLIDHILNHDPDEFKFCGEKKITRPTRIPNKKGNDFKYKQYRESMARDNEWPEKTVDTSSAAYWFTRGDWNWTKSKLVLLDFPGERLADVCIAKCSSFEDWSDSMLSMFKEHKELTTLSKRYFEVLAAESVTEEQILNTYKEVLASMHLHYIPLVSPSYFLLDAKGKHLDAKNNLSWNQRYLGLPPQVSKRRVFGRFAKQAESPRAREFAPLSPELRECLPEIRAVFAKNYSSYRKIVVLPLFKRLLRCNSAAILIDIPAILAGGPGRFNAMQEVLDSYATLYRERSILSQLMGLSPKTSRVAFVASKADLVRISDADKLLGLLKELTHHYPPELNGIVVENFAVSAVVSTKKVEDNAALQGIPWNENNPKRDIMLFDVPELPDCWPSDWDLSTFQFQRVYPDWPKLIIRPPKQRQLDKLFGFLTDRSE